MIKQISKITYFIFVLMLAGVLSGCDAFSAVNSITQEKAPTEDVENTEELSEETHETDIDTKETDKKTIAADERSESRNMINPSVYLSANTRFNTSSAAGATRKTTSTKTNTSTPSYTQNNQLNTSQSGYTNYETPSDYNNEERFNIPDGWDSKTVEQRGNTTVTTYTYTIYYDGPTSFYSGDEQASAPETTLPEPVEEAPSASAEEAPAEPDPAASEASE